MKRNIISSNQSMSFKNKKYSQKGEVLVAYILCAIIFLGVAIGLIELGTFGYKKIALNDKLEYIVKNAESRSALFAKYSPGDLMSYLYSYMKCENGKLECYSESEIPSAYNDEKCKFWLSLDSLSENPRRNTKRNDKENNDELAGIRLKDDCYVKVALLLPGFTINPIKATYSSGDSNNNNKKKPRYELTVKNTADTTTINEALRKPGEAIQAEARIVMNKGLFTFFSKGSEVYKVAHVGKPRVAAVASSSSGITDTFTNTPTVTNTITKTLPVTDTFTETPTITLTKTKTPTITDTITKTPTITHTLTITSTTTPTTTITTTNTITNTVTNTSTISNTATATITNTNTATIENTGTWTSTHTPILTDTTTDTPIVTNTPIITDTPEKRITITETVSVNPSITTTPISVTFTKTPNVGGGGCKCPSDYLCMDDPEGNNNPSGVDNRCCDKDDGSPGDGCCKNENYYLPREGDTVNSPLCCDDGVRPSYVALPDGSTVFTCNDCSLYGGVKNSAGDVTICCPQDLPKLRGYDSDGMPVCCETADEKFCGSRCCPTNKYCAQIMGTSKKTCCDKEGEVSCGGECCDPQRCTANGPMGQMWYCCPQNSWNESTKSCCEEDTPYFISNSNGDGGLCCENEDDVVCGKSNPVCCTAGACINDECQCKGEGEKYYEFEVEVTKTNVSNDVNQGSITQNENNHEASIVTKSICCNGVAFLDENNEPDCCRTNDKASRSQGISAWEYIVNKDDPYRGICCEKDRNTGSITTVRDESGNMKCCNSGHKKYTEEKNGKTYEACCKTENSVIDRAYFNQDGKYVCCDESHKKIKTINDIQLCCIINSTPYIDDDGIAQCCEYTIGDPPKNVLSAGVCCPEGYQGYKDSNNKSACCGPWNEKYITPLNNGISACCNIGTEEGFLNNDNKAECCNIKEKSLVTASNGREACCEKGGVAIVNEAGGAECCRYDNRCGKYCCNEKEYCTQLLTSKGWKKDSCCDPETGEGCCESGYTYLQEERTCCKNGREYISGYELIEEVIKPSIGGNQRQTRKVSVPVMKCCEDGSTIYTKESHGGEKTIQGCCDDKHFYVDPDDQTNKCCEQELCDGSCCQDGEECFFGKCESGSEESESSSSSNYCTELDGYSCNDGCTCPSGMVELLDYKWSVISSDLKQVGVVTTDARDYGWVKSNCRCGLCKNGTYEKIDGDIKTTHCKTNDTPECDEAHECQEGYTPLLTRVPVKSELFGGYIASSDKLMVTGCTCAICINGKTSWPLPTGGEIERCIQDSSESTDSISVSAVNSSDNDVISCRDSAVCPSGMQMLNTLVRSVRLINGIEFVTWSETDCVCKVCENGTFELNIGDIRRTVCAPTPSNSNDYTSNSSGFVSSSQSSRASANSNNS